MNIPAWLRGVMEENGYRGVRHMAQELGVNYASLDRWMNGITRPSLPSCRQLSTATGTPYDQVVLMAYVESDGEGSDEGDGSH